MKRILGTVAASALVVLATVLPAGSASAQVGGCGWQVYSTGVAASCNVLSAPSAMRAKITCKLSGISGGYTFTQYGPWVSTSTTKSRALCPAGSSYLPAGGTAKPYEVRF